MQIGHGTFCWNELNTRDPEGAVKHYGALMGWDFETSEMADGSTYRVAVKDGQFMAGVFDMTPHEFLNGIPDHWFSYIAVDDVDKMVEDMVAAGGSVRRPPFDVPGTGRIAIVQDPIGAVVGVMTMASP